MFTFSPQLNRSKFPAYGSTSKLARKMALHFAIDFCLYVITVLLCHLVAAGNMQPYQRGFYCDDTSIRYSFQQQRIPIQTFTLIIGAMILATIGFVELFYKYRCSKWGWPETENIFDIIVRFMLFIDCCLCVLVVIYLITTLTKYLVGRLRPHFLDVCRASVNITACELEHEYIQDYTCAGGETWAVKQARLSFFSGHASMSFGIAMFCALYMQVNLPFSTPVPIGRIIGIEGTYINLPFRLTAQVLLFLIAVIVSSTRVIDHFHFISDVVVGAVVGCAVAAFTAVFVVQLFSVGFAAPTDETNPLVGSNGSSWHPSAYVESAEELGMNTMV